MAISCRDARTGNALVSNALRLELDLWFEPRLGRIGAEDHHFFRRLANGGGRIVWCDEATVHETVLRERLSRRWLLKWAFRGGQSYVLAQRLADGVPAAGLSVATGLLAFPGFLALGLVAYPFRPALGFRLLQRAAVQIGKVTILTPFRYRSYEPKP
jgi:succinoglycan biosynthesis protein ExoM